LPKLSAGLEALEIIECPSIEDFSGARDARILSLNFSTGREPMNPASPLALYENFSELRRLSIGSIAGSYPEISLTHLKELSFYNCKSREPIEVNAPNLEILSFEESPDVQLRGNYSTGVTELTLGGYGTFPEGEGWDSLETVRVYSDDPDSKVELPQLPWLRKLETKGGPVLTNGVEVSNILEYKQAWQMRSSERSERWPIASSVLRHLSGSHDCSRASLARKKFGKSDRLAFASLQSSSG